MSHTTNCGCTETQETTHICGCAPSTPCECPILDLSTDCILYMGENIQCQSTNVVLKNTVLSVGLKNIVDLFCLKFDEIANRFRIVSIGSGAKVYRQENLLGQKELRTLISSDTSVTITEGTTTIDITVPDYPIVPTASNVGTGAGVFKELSANDYKFRKIKSTNSSVTVIEGINDIDLSVAIPNGSETKVTQGTNVTVTGTGTIATPYIINSTDTNTTYSPGASMSLVGTTFNNTAPDQIVALTQGGATTITGTYPNFIISSTDTNTTYSAGGGLALIGTAFSIDSLQKVITYPTDFTGTNYTITSTDNNYTIIVDNVATAVTITVPSGLVSKIGVGFIQKGTADVTFVASGTTIYNPIGLKIKGQYYQTFIEQELATTTVFLLGNTKV